MRCFCVLLLAWPAAASTILFTTPPGSVNPFDSQPVAASALFSTSPGAISVTLENLLANPSAVSQNVAGLMFMLAGGSPDGASLLGSQGAWIRVAKDRTWESLGAAPAGWLLVPATGGLQLCAACAAAWPTGTLIGRPAGLFGAANGSIAGSGSHNPFLLGPLQFQVAAPGVGSQTLVHDVVFSFGTTAGANVAAEATVPEPSTTLPAALGSLFLLWLISSKYARQMGADPGRGAAAGHRRGGCFAAAPPEGRGSPAGPAAGGCGSSSGQ
ncbi:MAG: hypothetical protein ACE15B_10670 [Bryobacteraceae bacterium]